MQEVECQPADDGVMVLTLNRPQARNALAASMREELIAVLRDLQSNDDVRAVVITGKAGHFCAGGDIKTMGEKDPAKLAERMQGAARGAMLVGTFPKPLVAAVAGHAAGAGVSIACLCDVVVAAPDARFTVSFLRIGLCPDWGLTHSLATRVGHARARRLMMSCEQVDANEAFRIGLVDALCAQEQLLADAVKQAAHLATHAPGAVCAVKRMMVDRDALASALQHEAEVQCQRFASAEHAEGITAFIEKRPPRFRQGAA